jgi:sphingomyelin phosphodiesterase 2
MSTHSSVKSRAASASGADSGHSRRTRLLAWEGAMSEMSSESNGTGAGGGHGQRPQQSTAGVTRAAAAAVRPEPADEDVDVDQPVEIKVFTLNCWGLRFVSEKRAERMEHIGHYLSNSDYDVVMLQEVWMGEDFERIRVAVSDTLPHSHFFDNGVIGSGTCIFTRAQINDATFHEFTMNGYPHKVWHGDWFGGKGLGVCQINFRGFDVHLYTSHYHAEYDRLHDVYLGHRVVHALESAQWIKLASSSADLTIYAGDFNTEPRDVPYKLLRSITPLVDAWRAAHGGSDEGGETCDCPTNSFAHPTSVTEYPNGKRIDYIMYQPGPNVMCETVHCSLPLPNRVPGKRFSFSDHEAVTATLRMRRAPRAAPLQTAPEYRRHCSVLARSDCVQAVDEAVSVS